MPSRRELKAASTPSVPGASPPAVIAVVVVFFGAVFAGASAGVCDLFVFVVVRGRGVAVEEFEFCAATTPHVRTIKANTLSIIDSSPWNTAAQPLHRRLATDDIKYFEHRWSNRLTGEHRACTVDKQTSLHTCFVRKSTQRCFRSLHIERLDSFQLIRETIQQLSQTRLLAQIFVDCRFVKIEIVGEVRTALLRKIFQREVALSNEIHSLAKPR